VDCFIQKKIFLSQKKTKKYQKKQKEETLPTSSNHDRTEGLRNDVSKKREEIPFEHSHHNKSEPGLEGNENLVWSPSVLYDESSTFHHSWLKRLEDLRPGSSLLQ
jgi:hypothetical protein